MSLYGGYFASSFGLDPSGLILEAALNKIKDGAKDEIIGMGTAAKGALLAKAKELTDPIINSIQNFKKSIENTARNLKEKSSFSIGTQTEIRREYPFKVSDKKEIKLSFYLGVKYKKELFTCCISVDIAPGATLQSKEKGNPLLHYIQRAEKEGISVKVKGKYRYCGQYDPRNGWGGKIDFSLYKAKEYKIGGGKIWSGFIKADYGVSVGFTIPFAGKEIGKGGISVNGFWRIMAEGKKSGLAQKVFGYPVTPQTVFRHTVHKGAIGYGQADPD